MRDITLRLALIQSLVVPLEVFEITNLGTLNFAATSPLLPKHCEQICILDVHFICKWFYEQTPHLPQAAQAYSLYFVWNFGSKRFIRLSMGI